MDLKHIIFNYYKDYKTIQSFPKVYSEAHSEILKITSFLGEEASLPNRIFCIEHDICSIPKCLKCNKSLTFNKNLKKYSAFCSSKCSNSSKEVKDKKKSSMVKAHGCENAFQTKKAKANFKEYYSEAKKHKKQKEKRELEKTWEEILKGIANPNRTKLKDLINTRKNAGKKVTSFEREHPVEYKIILALTGFLPKNSLLSERLHCIEKDILEIPKCKECEEGKVSFDIYLKEYRSFCSNTCASSNDEIRQRISNKLNKVPPEAYIKLEDRDWLFNQYITLDKPATQICQELGTSNDVLIGRYLKRHNIPIKHRGRGTSRAEKELANFIKELFLDEEILTNDRSILPGRLELDIVLPFKKIALEYCGLYYHSTAIEKYRYNKEAHLTKLELTEAAGYRLITIFEDEWSSNKELIKQKVKNILGMGSSQTIYARKCNIESIQKDEKQKFLKTFHIQGDGPSSINLGLFSEGILISVMTFKKRNKKKVFELTRFASSCNVVGAFGKLLKYFQRNFEWEEIVSFADRRWSNRKNIYTKTGFTLDKTLKPDYKYCIQGNRSHKFNFRKKKLAKLFPEHYNDELTGREILDSLNIYKIYDCGLLKYVLRPAPGK